MYEFRTSKIWTLTSSDFRQFLASEVQIRYPSPFYIEEKRLLLSRKDRDLKNVSPARYTPDKSAVIGRSPAFSIGKKLGSSLSSPTIFVPDS